jgi:hypothetical protein
MICPRRWWRFVALTRLLGGEDYRRWLDQRRLSAADVTGHLRRVAAPGRQLGGCLAAQPAADPEFWTPGISTT